MFLLSPLAPLFLQSSCQSVIYHCFFLFLCSSCCHHCESVIYHRFFFFLRSSCSHDVSPSYIIASSSSSSALSAAINDSVIYHCFCFFLPTSCSHDACPSYIIVSSSSSALPAVMMSIRHISLHLLLPLLFLQSSCDSVIYHCFFFFFLPSSCSHHVIPSYIIVSSSSSALPAVMMSVHHVSLFPLLPLLFLRQPLHFLKRRQPCIQRHFRFLADMRTYRDPAVLTILAVLKRLQERIAVIQQSSFYLFFSLFFFFLSFFSFFFLNWIYIRSM